MPKNRATHIIGYSYDPVEALLPDTNFWLYVLPAPSESASTRSEIYADAFVEMQAKGSTLLLHSIVLSEYLNRYCRIEWNALGAPSDFKRFRGSRAFEAICAEAMQQVRRMLAVTTRVDDRFSELDLMHALATFADGTTDANDAILTEAGQRHDCALVTDDGDFRFGGIRMITGNRRLLASCS